MSPDVIYDYSKAPRMLATFQAIAVLLSRSFTFNIFGLWLWPKALV